MDQLEGHGSPFAHFVAAALNEEGFVLIDVGAAGGVAAAWRSFGDKLRGFGFDPDPREVERLNRIELAPGFQYVAGLVELPSDHPFALKGRGQPRLVRNPWSRLAVERWFEVQRAREKGFSFPETLLRSLPTAVELTENTDDLPEVIDLPRFLVSRGVTTIDFMKIDVDGTDYDILQSLDAWYDKFRVLGIGVEVNFFGSDSDTGNTFHNIDRFLKGHGFELLDFSVRRYPLQELPDYSRAGLPYPAATRFGRPYQGDAFYARDICAEGQGIFAQSLSAERLAKSAALFSLFGLPDCAAEVLVTFRDRLGTLMNVDRGLDLLARQAQPERKDPLCYREYITAFERGAFEGLPPQTAISARFRPLKPHAYETSRRIVFEGGSCTDGPALRIRTRPGRWEHAVEFPLNVAGLDPDKHLVIALEIRVHKGSVGVGVLSHDGRSFATEEVITKESDDISLVELLTPRVSNSGSIVVRNAAPDGAVSELDLRILAVSPR